MKWSMFEYDQVIKIDNKSYGDHFASFSSKIQAFITQIKWWKVDSLNPSSKEEEESQGHLFHMISIEDCD